MEQDRMEITASRVHGNVLLAANVASAWRSVETTLNQCGFDIGRASTGKEALMRLRRTGYDMVVVDLDLPGMDGIETCTLIRNEFSTIWILVVAFHDTVEERIRALDAGADHYITKPFHLREFAARLRAMARRTSISLIKPREPINVGIFYLDLDKRTVKKSGREIHLTTTEFNLLYQLMANTGQPVLHSTLLDLIWGQHGAKELGYLRIYISQLRKKIETVPSHPRFLLTYMSVGYIFADPAAKHLHTLDPTRNDHGHHRAVS